MARCEALRQYAENCRGLARRAPPLRDNGAQRLQDGRVRGAPGNGPPPRPLVASPDCIANADAPTRRSCVRVTIAECKGLIMSRNAKVPMYQSTQAL